mmetsp:Transcript_941/g.1850  ORF Transcript_941/g.1850 Transcript_941/m.1850 type:complete len:537 (+) Transcript_941:353-1963(+)
MENLFGDGFATEEGQSLDAQDGKQGFGLDPKQAAPKQLQGFGSQRDAASVIPRGPEEDSGLWDLDFTVRSDPLTPARGSSEGASFQSNTECYDSESGTSESKKRKVAASKVAREKRKQEIDFLRNKNEQLVSEREALLKQINTLKSDLEHNFGGSKLDDLLENKLLKEQVNLHRQFMASFKEMISFAPTETSAKAKMYKEAAEQGRTIMLGVLAQSQSGKAWRKALLPPELCGLKDVKLNVYYRFSDAMFGDSDDNATDSDQSRNEDIQYLFNKKRIELRYDVAFRSLTPQQLSGALRGLLIDQREKLRLWGIKNDDKCELKTLEQELNDGNTMLLYHRTHLEPPQKDRDTVFLFDHHKCKLTRSTLALPKIENAQSKQRPKPVREPGDQPRKRGRPVGSKAKKDHTWIYGEVDADILMRTSTSLVANRPTAPDAQQISEPIFHSAIVFEEEELLDCDEGSEPERVPSTRAIVLVSNSTDWCEQQESEDWNRIFQKDGMIQPRFAAYIYKLLSNIKVMYGGQPPSESAADSSSATT